ncbi:MAG: ThuA domain-containing protein [Bacteroidetes bacterium]|nr:ThuA domain-containing protein [Bacteroidota bacterium]
MKQRILATCFAIVAVAFAFSSFAQGKQFKALLFTRTQGFHHESINEGVTAIKAMAQRNFFDVAWHEDPAKFNDEELKQYDVIIFLNTTGDILNDEQQAAMERFIRSGKGFVGIHSASDTEYDWPWYVQMVGRTFHIHPTIQTARIKVLDRKFPGFELMPDDRLWTDEWYQFDEEKSKDLHYLLSVDEATYNPKADWGRVSGTGMGSFHPLAWYHNYDGGRAFYTALGHMPEKYSDPAFLEHLYGGIYWAATGKGMK